MNLVDYVFRAAEERHRWSEAAILCGDRRLSYAELYGAVRRFAGAVRELGVARGDRIAIVARLRSRNGTAGRGQARSMVGTSLERLVCYARFATTGGPGG